MSTVRGGWAAVTMRNAGLYWGVRCEPVPVPVPGPVLSEITEGKMRMADNCLDSDTGVM